MNGRLYDPLLHRFLQPDNNIQDPSNTQNYNRYGYVLNNPLKYIDPSGEFGEGLGSPGGNGVGVNPIGDGSALQETFSDPANKAWFNRNFNLKDWSNKTKNFFQRNWDSLWGNNKDSGPKPLQPLKTDGASSWTGGGSSQVVGNNTGNWLQRLRDDNWLKDLANDNWLKDLANDNWLKRTSHITRDWSDENIRGPIMRDLQPFRDGVKMMRDINGEILNEKIGGVYRAGAEYGLLGSGMGTGHVGAFRKVVKYTKSSLQLGQQMHRAYKAGLINGVTRFKEFTGIKGIRPDFVDFGTKTIYELKPYNPRQIELGTKQLNKYKALFEQKYGGTWKTVLEYY
jgi:hypothetical protein